MEQQDQLTTREIAKSSASSSLSAGSPSFTAYSSQNLADIAARVLHELNLTTTTDPYDNEHFFSDFHQQPNSAESNRTVNNNNSIDEEEDVHGSQEDEDEDEDEDIDSESEFEFAVLCGGENTSPTPADEIFCNGQIKPTYPVFDTSLVYGSSQTLRRLLKEDRHGYGHGNENGSCSSSEGDELEGVPEGTYCVWAPQKTDMDEMMKKKSKSTGSVGSSKRWRFRDLLHRNNSDGKDAFVFLAPRPRQINDHGKNVGEDGKKEVKVNGVKSTMVNGGKRRGEEKKKSYLPYRQDLVGLFANVNGLSRTVRPF